MDAVHVDCKMPTIAQSFPAEIASDCPTVARGSGHLGRCGVQPSQVMEEVALGRADHPATLVAGAGERGTLPPAADQTVRSADVLCQTVDGVGANGTLVAVNRSSNRADGLDCLSGAFLPVLLKAVRVQMRPGQAAIVADVGSLRPTPPAQQKRQSG